MNECKLEVPPTTMQKQANRRRSTHVCTYKHPCLFLRIRTKPYSLTSLYSTIYEFLLFTHAKGLIILGCVASRLKSSTPPIQKS